MLFKYRRITNVFYHLFLILFGAAMLYTLIWMLFASFKPNTEIF